jgi:hypothetical protein
MVRRFKPNTSGTNETLTCGVNSGGAPCRFLIVFRLGSQQDCGHPKYDDRSKQGQRLVVKRKELHDEALLDLEPEHCEAPSPD